MQKIRLVFLVGPTAIGKTGVAIYLAKKLNSEIISCDSMQLYKGMDIITSKPNRSTLEKVPHHLIGVISPGREYNVTKYRSAALKEIIKIVKKKRVPLFVGGTGLYMSVVLDGIFNVDAQDQKFRDLFYKKAQRFGSVYLHKKLQEVDAPAACKIHPNDLKRIIRALEVFNVTGKPISQLQKQRKGLSDNYDVKIFCLNMDRGKLYKRIDERVERMFRDGLIKEAKKLLSMKLSKTASVAIGLKELKGYLEGSCDLQEAKDLMKRNTRQYAKRQLTWFRKDKRVQWINIKDNETSTEVAKRLWKKLS